MAEKLCCQLNQKGAIKSIGHSHMECGGKRSATPLWLERLALRWIRHKHKPKRRRASLAAALHNVPERDRQFLITPETGEERACPKKNRRAVAETPV